ncbi:MAG: TonB-dependent receptor [Verrucomicrobia bacterium]|nr:TonB-dependent receptor [Verrucomicrobiota bacterium]
MKYCRLLSVVAVLVLSHVVLRADTNRLTEVLVTSTRIPSESESTPAAVTVIQGDEIELQQIRTVADALRAVPGLSVVQSGQPGGVTAVFMRGSNSKHTLVLIDGVRVNNGFDSLFDFNNLPLDNVDRIEVLRGPQSTLYGSEALGGVIHVITKRGAEKWTGAATFEGGSYDSIRPRVSFAGSSGKLSLSGAGSYFSSDNDRLNSAVRQRDMTGSVRYQFLERLDLTVSGWFRSSHAGSPGLDSLWGNDPNDFLNGENTAVAAVVHAQPFDVWDARLTLSHNHDRKFWNGAPNVPGGDYSYARTTTDRDQVDFQNLFAIADHHQLVAGMSFDNIHANRVHDDYSWWSGASGGVIAPTVRNFAGYAQYEFAPCPRATLNAGLRLDSYNTFGAELTYRVGARYTVPHTETILRANFGTGFRAPGVDDLYFPVYGNPHLEPERSIGWDAGFEQAFFENKLRIGANYFQNEYDNLIQYSVTNWVTWAGTMMNVQQAQTIGIESFGTWTPWKELLVRGSYTWLPTAEDRVTNQRLLRRPRHTGELLANYRFLRRFGATVRAQLVGDRHDYDPVTSDLIKSGAYFKLDLGLSCEVCKHFTVFGRIENVTDENYYEAAGYPAMGRVFWGGGTVKF